MAGTNRTSVYWGVEPYPKGHEGFETPYPEWQQAQARDLGEADFNGLLKSARQWLQEPMLAAKTEGLLPDIRFRAALDLAFQTTGDGKYSVGVHPATYNMLLARLAGKPEEGTLLTIREASDESVYHPRRERTIMRASTRIRQYASKFATTQPEVAFDLLDLAGKVAEDEQKEAEGQQAQDGQQKQGGEMPPALKKHMEEKGGDKKEDEGQDQGQQKQGQDQGEGQQDQGQQKQAYAKLKAATIRLASENPALRQALLPALKLIRQLG